MVLLVVGGLELDEGVRSYGRIQDEMALLLLCTRVRYGHVFGSFSLS